jgi:hypothetical protein
MAGIERILRIGVFSGLGDNSHVSITGHLYYVVLGIISFVQSSS